MNTQVLEINFACLNNFSIDRKVQIYDKNFRILFLYIIDIRNEHKLSNQKRN